MNIEIPEIHGYGDEFDSIEEIEKAVEEREKLGLNLNGAAILWSKKEDQEYFDRRGVRILPDGSISFAHAEDL